MDDIEMLDYTILQPPVLHTDHTVPPSCSPLLTLPGELLALIAMELEFKSLLWLRSTCRTMREVSRGCQVWQHLFSRQLGVTIPRPFFLSKPLSDCSAEDIANDLRRWEMVWESPLDVTYSRRGVADFDVEKPQGKTSTFFLLPGGRWFIAGYCDGSVWYTDLTDDNAAGEVIPRVLLASPFEGTVHAGNAIQIQLSIDYTSDDALGPSRESHHLQQFNIARAACPKDYKSGLTHIEVWRVHLEEADDVEGQLRLGDRLSSFTEISTAGLFACSLYGRMLAYSMGLVPARCIVIIDWAEADRSKDMYFSRRYLPRSAPKTIRLLPGDRLLAMYGDVPTKAFVYDWASDCPTSNLPPNEQRFDRVVEKWHCSTQMINVLAMPPAPMVLRNEVRLIMPTSRHAYSLIIPVDGGAVKTYSLLRARFGGCVEVQAFGYHRGVGINDFTGITASQYSWPEEAPNPTARPPNYTTQEFRIQESGMERPARLLFDRFSNRIIVTDLHTSRFFFMSLSR